MELHNIFIFTIGSSNFSEFMVNTESLDTVDVLLLVRLLKDNFEDVVLLFFSFSPVPWAEVPVALC